MGEYQKYIILNFCNKIIERQKDNDITKKINLKHVIKKFIL